MQIEKENQNLFANYIIVNTENSKEFIKMLLGTKKCIY